MIFLYWIIFIVSWCAWIAKSYQTGHFYVGFELFLVAATFLLIVRSNIRASKKEINRIENEIEKKEQDKSGNSKIESPNKREDTQIDSVSPNMEEKKLKMFCSGSGFFVSELGHIITNRHVIESASAIRVPFQGETLDAKILRVDPNNDLALLKVEKNSMAVLALSNESPFLGQEIRTAGYPLIDEVGEDLKVTAGVISALSGLQNNSMVQIDAAIHPGSSGGPVFDQLGNVLGVATLGKKNHQNMNFAIKASIVKNFLEPSGILLRNSTESKIDNRQFSYEMQRAVVIITCWS